MSETPLLPLPPRQRLALRTKLRFSLGCLCGVLILAEIAADIAMYRRHERRRAQGIPLVGVDEHLYLLKPGYQGKFGSREGAPIAVESNALGLRDDAVAVPKPQGLTRVICLGDSVTFGFGTTRDRAYPQRLEAMLAQHPVAGRAFEVINAGVYGYDAPRCLMRLNLDLFALQPDLILVFCGWNDMVAMTKPYSAPGAPAPPVLWWEHLGLLQYLQARGPSWRAKLLGDDAVADDLVARVDLNADNRLEEPAIRLYEANLRALVQVARSKAAPIMLGELPNFAKLPLSETAKRKMTWHLAASRSLSSAGWVGVIQRVNGIIRRVAREEGAHLITVPGLDDESLFLDTCHPTEEGLSLMAAAIADRLRGDEAVFAPAPR